MSPESHQAVPGIFYVSGTARQSWQASRQQPRKTSTAQSGGTRRRTTGAVWKTAPAETFPPGNQRLSRNSSNDKGRWSSRAVKSGRKEISAGQIEASLQEIQIPTAVPEDSAVLPEPPVPNQGTVQEEGALPSPPEVTAREQFLQELTVPVAGYYPEVQLPEAPGGSWSGVQEELTFSGPAPLTAEAVSLAFQRDDRRYDNGCPLY